MRIEDIQNLIGIIGICVGLLIFFVLVQILEVIQ